MTDYRPYKITVRLSGAIENFETNNGVKTFNPQGNKRTTENSALNYVKNYAKLAGCKVEEVLKIEKVM